jgi:hypothetical protein
LLRCFEHADSDWLWILGDDDEPLPGALARVQQAIREHSDFASINFSSGIHRRSISFQTSGVDETIRRLDSFSNLQFISANVYQLKFFQPHLRLGYLFAYTMAPHLVLLLNTLAENRKIFFSEQDIVQWQPPSATQFWSKAQQMLGTWLLLDMPIPLATRRCLAEKISRESTKPGEIIYWALNGVQADQRRLPEMRQFLRLVENRQRPWVGWTTRLKWKLARLIVSCPRSLGQFFNRWYSKKQVGAPFSGSIDQFHRC